MQYHITCTQQRFQWRPPQLLPGLLYSGQIFMEHDLSRTKFPTCNTKTGEIYCFDSSLKPIFVNHSVLKYCSALINLIKSLHWAAIRAWIYLHDFNIPHTSLGIVCFEEDITLQQNGEQYHCWSHQQHGRAILVHGFSGVSLCIGPLLIRASHQEK